MTRTTVTDDELIELLDHTMRRVAKLAPALPIEAARPSRWPVTAAAATIAVIGVGGIALLMDRPVGPSQPAAQHAPGAATAPRAPVDTAVPHGTIPIDEQDNGQPRWANGTDPAMFPSTVPMPEDAETVTAMEWDALRVGWEFAGRQDPTAGVDRCARYAEAFDDTWTSTPDTDEHMSVLFAHHYNNDSWDVGIYCTDNGDFLVQVLSLDATSTQPPTSG